MTLSIKTWLAAHLYYAEPWEEFLINAVKPYVDTVLEKKLAEQFFFVRYWERGPHIRLRFKGKKHILDQKTKPQLESFFLNYFKKNSSRRNEPERTRKLTEEQSWFPNNSLQFIPYEPEVERYGGPVGILISEKQFEVSSRAVLSIIKESNNWDYDRALGAAIQLHLSFAFSLGMDLTETTQFYSHIFKIWFSHAYGAEPNISAEESKKSQDLALKAFDENFSRQKSILIPYHEKLLNAFEDNTEFEQAWLNSWLQEMTIVGNELRDAQKKRQLIIPDWFNPSPEINVPEANQKLWPILESYVHMTNNRLGILNRDEAYLGYLIKRSLEHL